MLCCFRFLFLLSNATALHGWGVVVVIPLCCFLACLAQHGPAILWRASTQADSRQRRGRVFLLLTVCKAHAHAHSGQSSPAPPPCPCRAMGCCSMAVVLSWWRPPSFHPHPTDLARARHDPLYLSCFAPTTPTLTTPTHPPTPHMPQPPSKHPLPARGHARGPSHHSNPPARFQRPIPSPSLATMPDVLTTTSTPPPPPPPPTDTHTTTTTVGTGNDFPSLMEMAAADDPPSPLQTPPRLDHILPNKVPSRAYPPNHPPSMYPSTHPRMHRLSALVRSNPQSIFSSHVKHLKSRSSFRFIHPPTHPPTHLYRKETHVSLPAASPTNNPPSSSSHPTHPPTSTLSRPIMGLVGGRVGKEEEEEEEEEERWRRCWRR